MFFCHQNIYNKCSHFSGVEVEFRAECQDWISSQKLDLTLSPRMSVELDAGLGVEIEPWFRS